VGALEGDGGVEMGDAEVSWRKGGAELNLWMRLFVMGGINGGIMECTYFQGCGWRYDVYRGH